MTNKSTQHPGSRSGNNLGRFREVIKGDQVLKITDYEHTRNPDQIKEDFRGLICMVAFAKDVKAPAKVVDVNAEHQMGSDGWIKVWPMEDDERVPDNKLWLYQPRAVLVKDI